MVKIYQVFIIIMSKSLINVRYFFLLFYFLMSVFMCYPPWCCIPTFDVVILSILCCYFLFIMLWFPFPHVVDPFLLYCDFLIMLYFSFNYVVIPSILWFSFHYVVIPYFYVVIPFLLWFSFHHVVVPFLLCCDFLIMLHFSFDYVAFPF